MAERQVKSREAKVDLDEDVLEGEKAKTPKETLREMKCLTSIFEERCYFAVNKVYTADCGNLMSYNLVEEPK